MLAAFSSRERGQTIPVFVVLLVTLLGLAALVVDLGTVWYTKRQLQASVDAAVLAGAQDLPSTTTARATTQQYLASNGPAFGSVATADISFHCTQQRVANCATTQNAETVRQTVHVPLLFARVLGIDTMDVSTEGTACQPCGTMPLDVVVVFDRTGSMNAYNKLSGAKSGVNTLFSLLDRQLDRIGLAVLPPQWPTQTDPCAAGTKSGVRATYDHPDSKYLIDGLSSGFRNADGTVNASSPIVQHVACITAGGSTSYADALRAARAELDRAPRPKTQRVIVFMTDGEANLGAVYTCSSLSPAAVGPCTNHPASGPENMQPCQTAIDVAAQLKASGIQIYTIGYGLGLGAGYCTAGTGADENPQITPQVTLETIASDASPDPKVGHTFYNNPASQTLNATFARIASDMTQGTSRLVDSTY